MSLETLKAYSAMIREKRASLNLPQAILAKQAGVSTKTLVVIEKEYWPKNGKLTRQQKQGQARAMQSLAVILGFDKEEWAKALDLPAKLSKTAGVIKLQQILGKGDLEYLLRVVEVSGSLKVDTLLDVLSQRGFNKVQT